MTELELMLDEGRQADAERFFRAGSELLSVLDELSDEPVGWVLSELRLGSSIARVAAPPSAPEAADSLKRLVRGLAAVQAGGALPDGWTPDAVTAARRLNEVGAEDPDAAQPPRLTLIEGPDAAPRSVQLTAELATKLADLQPFERAMPGAVRGMLAGVNVSRGNRASLRTTGGRVVRVSFTDELRGALKDALYGDVELAGQVRQDSDGIVFHIRAEGVKDLRKPALRWTQLFGYDPEITEGMAVEEYLESSRGEA